MNVALVAATRGGQVQHRDCKVIDGKQYCEVPAKPMRNDTPASGGWETYAYGWMIGVFLALAITGVIVNAADLLAKWVRGRA